MWSHPWFLTIPFQTVIRCCSFHLKKSHMCLLFSLSSALHSPDHHLSPWHLVLLVNCLLISILHILVKIIFQKFKSGHATSLKAFYICPWGFRILLHNPHEWDRACPARPNLYLSSSLHTRQENWFSFSSSVVPCSLSMQSLCLCCAYHLSGASEHFLFLQTTVKHYSLHSSQLPGPGYGYSL